MTKKTITKVRGISDETKIYLKKVDLKIDDAIKSLQKKWQDDQPRRDKYKKTIKADTNKFVKNSMQMSSDVVKTIKKDLRDFKKRK